MVIIKTDEPEYSEINKKQGVIIGLPIEDEEEKVYSVYFDDDYTWAIPENYLVSTGKFESETNIYDGSTIKIRVDKKGEGHVIE